MNLLKIDEIANLPKTKVYVVKDTTDNNEILGFIRWDNHWRKYVFEPEIAYETRWSYDCLVELANFIKELMEARK